MIQWGIGFGVILITAFLEYKWKILSASFNRKRLSHKLIKYFISVVGLVLAVLFYIYLSDSTQEIQYPLTKPVSAYNPFVQQFDAFKKKQLQIDFEPSQALLELENPYDPASRQGISYLWDRALYDGHYYSYFGVAPLITVYIPYYLVTSDLPSDSFVVAIFLGITTFFFPLILFEWAGRYTKKVPLSLLAIGALAGTFGTNVFLVARGVAHLYYIPVLAGMAFLSLFLFLVLRAFSKTKIKRYSYLFLSGIAFGLLFLSRVNIAVLAAFIILPMLWFFIIYRKDEKRTIFKVILELFFLGTPVLLALGFTLWFNNARFSSPFDFGTNYQLTVSDISQNELRLRDLPFTIFHYFLQGLVPSHEYPYVNLSWADLRIYGRYVYVDSNMGLLTTPIMYALFLSPAIIFGCKQSIRRRVMLTFTLFGMVFVAWLNFCMGGVIFRYTTDLTLIASLTSVIILLIIFECLVKKIPKGLAYVLGTFTALFFVYSTYKSMRIALISNGNLSIISEKVLEFFQKILPFI